MMKVFAIVIAAVSMTSVSTFADQTLLKKAALSLLESLEESGYGTRSICIFGDQVYGIQPGPHWSQPSMVASGTLNNFPQTLTQLTEQPYSMDYPNGPEDWSRFEVLKEVGNTSFIATSGKRSSAKADVCVFESKPVLE